MAEQIQPSTLTPTCMESVNRISKLPVVESTIKTATDIYGKVKDYNPTTQWAIGTAENVVSKGVEVGMPLAKSLAQNLEGPIKKVDEVLCTSLDYVESKVPAVKLPAGEMYNSTKEMVNKTVTPKVDAAYSYMEPVVKSAMERIDPAVQTAKNVVEPAMETVNKLVVDPAMEKVEQLKSYGSQKLGEFMGKCGHEQPMEHPECDECKAAVKKQEEPEGN